MAKDYNTLQADYATRHCILSPAHRAAMWKPSSMENGLTHDKTINEPAVTPNFPSNRQQTMIDHFQRKMNLYGAKIVTLLNIVLPLFYVLKKHELLQTIIVWILGKRYRCYTPFFPSERGRNPPRNAQEGGVGIVIRTRPTPYVWRISRLRAIWGKSGFD